eukprot:TRINITY_DN4629_c0_g1_i2.p1 TRINITY_DN4629_c0_g1~~TRINITY_DN4629_c0_g1_i2.p1  ORF type:complete len:231 (+),score=59.72 TRINITY_DN4629_c0_g1_i2:50-694(+)
MEGGGEKKVGVRGVKLLVYVMKLAAVVTSVLVVACYLFLIKQTVMGDSVILAKVMNVLSQVFYVLFCIGVLLTEMNMEFFLFEFSFMYTWPGRGIVQIFIAVDFLDSKEQINTQQLSSSTQDLITEICGYALLTVGFMYLLMGVLCVRRLTDSTEDQRQRRLEFEKRLHSHQKKKVQKDTAADEPYDDDGLGIDETDDGMQVTKQDTEAIGVCW